MKTFHAVVYDRKSPEGITLAEKVFKKSAPEAGHIRIKVHACGINPVDAKYLVGDKLPEFLPEAWRRRTVDGAGAGFDFAGEVIAIAPGDTTSFAVGDSVFGSAPPGQAGFAEFVDVPVHQVARAPTSLTLVEATALPLVGTTAIQALKYRCNLGEGQCILIIGASGGVGAIAVQIARHLVGRDGHIAAVCSARNHEFVKGLGADSVFDYSGGLPSLMEKLKASFGVRSKRFDLVLDCVSSLEEQDRAFDYIAHIHANSLLKRDLNAPDTSRSNYITIGGSAADWMKGVLRRRFGWNFFNADHELFWVVFPHSSSVLEEIAALADAGALRPHIQEIEVNGFRSVEPVREAFRKLRTRRVRGKLVLVV